jgi:hypothetical protein
MTTKKIICPEVVLLTVVLCDQISPPKKTVPKQIQKIYVLQNGPVQICTLRPALSLRLIQSRSVTTAPFTGTIWGLFPHFFLNFEMIITYPFGFVPDGRI